MEDLGNLVTRVPLAPVKREKMSQAQLEELVSREVKVSKFSKKNLFQAFPKSPEKREKVKLYQMGKQELEELLKKQRDLLRNKSLVANLPDKVRFVPYELIWINFFNICFRAKRLKIE